MTRVLLYSGGLDSYVADKLWRPDVRLYAALGHRYERQELDTIRRSGVQVVVSTRLALGSLERDDSIIPLRNLYLIALATHHGKTVALGALKGEVNGDKSERFRQQIEAVLSTCYERSYWSDGEPVQVEYPLAGYTKATLIAAWLKAGGSARELTENTRSCYSPRRLPCGLCSACVKRFIAMQANGIDEPHNSHPSQSPFLGAMRERWHSYDEQRRAEIVAAFPELGNA